MESFKIIYTVLGGLGIFFYGMKTMSDSLQLAAGDVIRKAINTITKNRFYSVLVGLFVTCIIQSSSVTTVMVVGFVNAGLMNLAQAIGVIFGANIGTTITGWIISIKVGKYGLLLIGAGIFPMLFAKSTKFKNIGKVLFGIGMIFFGLDIMSDAFKPLRTMPEFLNMISYFNGQNYGAYAACILMGCLLTMTIQSSSAMLGITIALAVSGVIKFPTAAALVMGENIGTTITAILASVGANINAKRAARAHAIFNILGVSCLFVVFPLYIKLIDYIVPGDPYAVNAVGDYTNVAVHIATSHSIFNITCTLLFLPFVNQLAKLVTKITPDKSVQEEHHLVVLGDPTQMLPASALAQAEAEIGRMKVSINKMYTYCDVLLRQTPSDMTQAEIIAKVKDFEKDVDIMQKEIFEFLVTLLRNPLTTEQSKQAQAILREADELESIADYIERLAEYTKRTPVDKLLTGEAREDFLNFYDEVKSYYSELSSKVLNPKDIDLEDVHRRSYELRSKAGAIRKNHLARISAGQFSPLDAMTFSDMIVALRKIRSHTQNVGEARV